MASVEQLTPELIAFETSRCRNCEQYLRDAQVLQTSLLPTGPLEDQSFEFAFRYSPFFEVGGDFADFFRLPNGFVSLYIGDVVGKGLPAAMYGALVMGALRGIHKTGTATARVLSLLNERLMQRPMSGRFCSTLYAVFDPATRILQFSNAGLDSGIQEWVSAAWRRRSTLRHVSGRHLR